MPPLGLVVFPVLPVLPLMKLGAWVVCAHASRLDLRPRTLGGSAAVLPDVLLRHGRADNYWDVKVAAHTVLKTVVVGLLVWGSHQG